MKAIRQYEFGAPDVLRYEDVVDPAPGPEQVRIAVRAAGVHLIDASIRAGRDAGPFPLPALPMTPGREVAGVVDAVGADVDLAWIGRRVVAHLGLASGGYAELAVAGVEALHVIPDGVADDVAVAMIGTGRTAIAILELARVGADDVALVTAAAGGLGSLLVQGARNSGAVVVAVAGGAEKVERVRALGATVAIDYSVVGWDSAVLDALDDRRPTVAFDGVGGELGVAARRLLAPGGRLLLFGFSSGEPSPISADDLWSQALTVSVAVGPHVVKRGLRPLEDAALAAAERGELVPLIGRPFALADAAAAHEAMTSRATVGKTILVP